MNWNFFHHTHDPPLIILRHVKFKICWYTLLVHKRALHIFYCSMKLRFCLKLKPIFFTKNNTSNVILFLIALTATRIVQEIFVRNVSEKRSQNRRDNTWSPSQINARMLWRGEVARSKMRRRTPNQSRSGNSLQVTTRTTKKSVLSSGRRRTKKIRNIPFLFIFHLFFKNDIRSGCNQRVEWSHAAKMTMVFAVQEKAPTKGVGQNGRTEKTDFKYENADFKR